jgi:hypothetical protein
MLNCQRSSSLFKKSLALAGLLCSMNLLAESYVIDYDSVAEKFKIDGDKLTVEFPDLMKIKDKTLSDIQAKADFENQKSGLIISIKKDGKSVHEVFGWIASTDWPDRWEITAETRKGFEEAMKVNPGKYTAEYQIMGSPAPYSKLNFELLSFKDPNPMAEGQTTNMIRGEWENMIFLTGGKSDDRVDMGVYLGRSLNPSKEEIVVDAAILKDGKIFARWGRYEKEKKGYPVSVDFEASLKTERFIKTSDNESEVEMKDLKDGKYSIVLNVDGKLRGSYPFEVKGGYYVLANRQDRANHKDPATAFYSKSKNLWLESK